MFQIIRQYKWYLGGVILLSCNKGLEPPPPPPPNGSLIGIVQYSGRWPSEDSLKDLRFVAMRVFPRSVADFTDLNNIEYSPGLKRYVDRDTFRILSIPNGIYPYSGIAQRFGNNVFLDWRPLGLYEGNSGRGLEIFGDTVRIFVQVDFSRLPPFPPPSKQILP
jgi:hypothetical protein